MPGVGTSPQAKNQEADITPQLKITLREFTNKTHMLAADSRAKESAAVQGF